MWYFAWILGTLLACSFGVITALALEHVESGKAEYDKFCEQERQNLYVTVVTV